MKREVSPATHGTRVTTLAGYQICNLSHYHTSRFIILRGNRGYVAQVIPLFWDVISKPFSCVNTKREFYDGSSSVDVVNDGSYYSKVGRGELDRLSMGFFSFLSFPAKPPPAFAVTRRTRRDSGALSGSELYVLLSSRGRFFGSAELKRRDFRLPAGLNLSSDLPAWC